MIDYPQLILLGALAGLTIFLGLPLAVVRSVNSSKKGFLNATAIGILIFLIVDVFGHAWEATEDFVSGALTRGASSHEAVFALLAMFGGVAIGLLGLTWYGTRFAQGAAVQASFTANGVVGGGGDYGHQRQELRLMHRVDAYRLSMMIAIGIGAHNFSEGLAIGQSYASGAMSLAIMLIVGFATHNATEGFGIAGPLTGVSERPSVRFLVLAGLVGGGPTFVGTLLGSIWASTLVYIFFLALAGGALVYVSMLMYNVGRRQTTNSILMLGFFVGITLGFLTDLLVSLGGA